MPELGRDVAAVLKMRQRCRANRCLPFPGSLNDQPEWVMDMFDTVDAATENFKARKHREQQNEMTRREQERTLGNV